MSAWTGSAGLLETESDPEQRVDLKETLEDLQGAYDAIEAIETVN